MTPLTFTVLGRPQTAGSKRAFPFKRRDGSLGVSVAAANTKTASWSQEVRCAAQRVHEGALLDGPLCMTVVFVLKRPKGHFGTRGLKPSSPMFPAVIPDLTKMLRALEDALTGVVWRDDAQIVEARQSKVYGEPERAVVAIWEAGAITESRMESQLLEAIGFTSP